MGLALIILVGWLVNAALFWIDGNLVMAGVSAAVSIAPLGLTRYLRRLAATEAARVYLRQQHERGISPAEARERVHELAPEGVTFDTDDVPNWPVYAIMLLGLAALVTLVIAGVSALTATVPDAVWQIFDGNHRQPAA